MSSQRAVSFARHFAGNRKGLFNVGVSFATVVVAGSMYKLKEERDTLVRDLGELQAEYARLKDTLGSDEWATRASRKLRCAPDALKEEVSSGLLESREAHQESAEDRILRDYGRIDMQGGKTKADLNRHTNAKIVL